MKQIFLGLLVLASASQALAIEGDLPHCWELRASVLRDAEPGFSCATSGGYVFKRVDDEQLGLAWLDMWAGVLWSDEQGSFSNFTHDAMGLPSRSAAQRAAQGHGFTSA
jgi:hypothetical protein